MAGELHAVQCLVQFLILSVAEGTDIVEGLAGFLSGADTVSVGNGEVVLRILGSIRSDGKGVGLQ